MADRRLKRAIYEWGMFASIGCALLCVALWLFPVAAWSTLVDLRFVQASTADCSTIRFFQHPGPEEAAIQPRGAARPSEFRWTGFGVSFRALTAGGRTFAWSIELSTLFPALACLLSAAVLLRLLQRTNRAADAHHHNLRSVTSA